MSLLNLLSLHRAASSGQATLWLKHIGVMTNVYSSGQIALVRKESISTISSRLQSQVQRPARLHYGGVLLPLGMRPSAMYTTVSHELSEVLETAGLGDISFKLADQLGIYYPYELLNMGPKDLEVLELRPFEYQRLQKLCIWLKKGFDSTGQDQLFPLSPILAAVGLQDVEEELSEQLGVKYMHEVAQLTDKQIVDLDLKDFEVERLRALVKAASAALVKPSAKAPEISTILARGEYTQEPVGMPRRYQDAGPVRVTPATTPTQSVTYTITPAAALASSLDSPLGKPETPVAQVKSAPAVSTSGFWAAALGTAKTAVGVPETVVLEGSSTAAVPIAEPAAAAVCSLDSTLGTVGSQVKGAAAVGSLDSTPRTAGSQGKATAAEPAAAAAVPTAGATVNDSWKVRGRDTTRGEKSQYQLGWSLLSGGNLVQARSVFEKLADEQRKSGAEFWAVKSQKAADLCTSMMVRREKKMQQATPVSSEERHAPAASAAVLATAAAVSSSASHTAVDQVLASSGGWVRSLAAGKPAVAAQEQPPATGLERDLNEMAAGKPAVGAQPAVAGLELNLNETAAGGPAVEGQPAAAGKPAVEAESAAAAGRGQYMRVTIADKDNERTWEGVVGANGASGQWLSASVNADSESDDGDVVLNSDSESDSDSSLSDSDDESVWGSASESDSESESESDSELCNDSDSDVEDDEEEQEEEAEEEEEEEEEEIEVEMDFSEMEEEEEEEEAEREEEKKGVSTVSSDNKATSTSASNAQDVETILASVLPFLKSAQGSAAEQPAAVAAAQAQPGAAAAAAPTAAAEHALPAAAASAAGRSTWAAAPEHAPTGAVASGAGRHTPAAAAEHAPAAAAAGRGTVEQAKGPSMSFEKELEVCKQWYNKGEYAIAERELVQLLKQGSDGANGIEAPRLAAYSLLGMSLYAQGRVDSARKCFSKVFLARQAQLGARHIDTILALNNLAASSVSEDKDAAWTMAKTALHLAQQALGDSHAVTVSIHDNIEALEKWNA